MSKRDNCEFCAMVDVATDDPHGMAEIDELDVAKAVLSRIARRLTVSEVLRRIISSQFPSALVQYLPHVYGNSTNALEPIAKALLKEGQSLMDEDELIVFADTYRSIGIRALIENGEYRKAYETIKDAFKGSNAPRNNDPTEIPIHGSPQMLAISRECLRGLVNELHTAMCEAGLLPGITFVANEEVIFYPGAMMCRPAGILFAHAIGGVAIIQSNRDEPWRVKCNFKTYGLQVIGIARYMNQLSKERRKERLRRQAEIVADA